jgi:hypothetical protein
MYKGRKGGKDREKVLGFGCKKSRIQPERSLWMIEF